LIYQIKQGNIMNYTINEYSIEQIGRSGSGRITCKIDGYWSYDPISLYVDRKGWKPGEANWTVTMSHSSGGRDSKEVACDMQASINFAEAMIQMANIGKSLLSLHGEALEKSYQDERAKLKAQFEAEKAALNAKIDADAAIGEAAAAGIVAEMIVDATTNTRAARQFYRRGSDCKTRVYAEKWSHTRFKMNGMPVSKKDVIAEIAKLSARIVEVTA
jgi:hypothetical protein